MWKKRAPTKYRRFLTLMSTKQNLCHLKIALTHANALKKFYCYLEIKKPEKSKNVFQNEKNEKKGKN